MTDRRFTIQRKTVDAFTKLNKTQLMTLNFLNRKPETDEQRIIRYADIMAINSNYEGEIDKDCLDVIGVFTKRKLPQPLEKIRKELWTIQPNYVDALGTVQLDISTQFVQNNYDVVKKHLLDYGYINQPDHSQKWMLNEVGKKMKQLKGHKKYQTYIDKIIKAEIAEIGGKIHWLRRAIIVAIVAAFVGYFLRYLTEPKEKKSADQPSTEGTQLSTPARQNEKNDSLYNN